MEMFNPPHPGEILREDCLKPLGLTVTAAAKGLGVSRGSLSELLNGHNGIRPRWRSVSKRRDGGRRNPGCAINCRMISGRRGGAPTRSR